LKKPPRSGFDEAARHDAEEVATRLGKSRPVIANALRLLQLPETVIDMLRNGTLSAGHGPRARGAFRQRAD
jgi:ParB family chromosome partitioning protein